MRQQLPVRLSYMGRDSKTKKCRKIKICIEVPLTMSKWSTNFQFERSKVKVTGGKNVQNLALSLVMGGSTGGSCAADADCTFGVRHC